MDFYDSCWHLGDLLETSRMAYVCTDPEVLDFSDGSHGKLVIQSEKKRVEFDLTPENAHMVMGVLDATLFTKEAVDLLLAWNIKSLTSYVRAFVPKPFLPSVNIIDLNVIEYFLNVDKKRPESYVEAVNRGKLVAKNPNWKRLYKILYLPLMFRVLPTLETTPLLNEAARSRQHAYYEIEGQINGRINSGKRFKNSYLPHSMGNDQKEVLKPTGYNSWFYYADYRGCEVCVLQWLSQDPELLKVTQSGKDIHAMIYETITGDACDNEVKREKAKLLFLPVMYGCSAKGLAAAISLTEEVARELIRRISTKFSVSWEWMAEQQRIAEEKGELVDYFCRTRQFDDGMAYKARDFAVQGVAASFCQEKLIELHDAMLENQDAYLCYFVHDGYVGVTRTSGVKSTYQIVKQVLESESKLCPGLSVGVRIQFGPKINKMKVYWT